MGFCPAFLLPALFEAAAEEKRGWQIMGRYLVLCLIFLSVLSFPGNASAIFGEVWSTDAYENALDPSKGPPSSAHDATFNVDIINFDSRRLGNQAKNISFDEFLNFPKWTYLGSEFDPGKKMFENNGQGNGDEGIFFKFTWELSLSPGSNPLTIIHDDGFYLLLATGKSFDFSGQFDEPVISKIDLDVSSSGNYAVTLYYGALNDTLTQVLIVTTPEPGTMLLLGLGVIGIGILRRKN